MEVVAEAEEDVELAYGRLGGGAMGDHFVDNLDLNMISKAFAPTRLSCATASGAANQISLGDLSELDTSVTENTGAKNAENAKKGISGTTFQGDFGSVGLDIDLDLLDEDGDEDFDF